jgi:hypothetical protein
LPILIFPNRKHHRLRYAITTQSFNRRLKGEVESEDTYVGGKEKNKHA